MVTVLPEQPRAGGDFEMRPDFIFVYMWNQLIFGFVFHPGISEKRDPPASQKGSALDYKRISGLGVLSVELLGR
jgi:hypothetical protein